MNFLDQGQLTSGAGDMVDARRAVVLMTTNVGQGAIAAAKSAQEGLSVKQGAPDIQAMKEEYSTRLTNRGMSAAGLGSSREASKKELAMKLAILQEEISSVKVELSKM